MAPRKPNTARSKSTARPKSVAKRKTVTKKQPVGPVDFDELQRKKNPDDRQTFIRESIVAADYVSLSDLLVNVRRGGHAVLARLLKQIDTEAKQGMGIRTWILKMVVNPDGSKPEPGQVVTWVRQRHNRLDYGSGKKIGADVAAEMMRRGEGHLLTEEAEVELDKNCCFEVAYQDAVDLLNKHGIYYLTFDPDGPRENDTPVSGMKRLHRNGTHNWRFVEMPPGFFDKPKRPAPAPTEAPPVLGDAPEEVKV